jgi:uncharacterized protein YbcI
MPQKSVGQLEALISEAMVKFEREHMGRGPAKTTSRYLDNFIIVRLEGVLTPAELQLAKDPPGVKLLKEVRTLLIEGASNMLKETISSITQRQVISLYSDISSITGERIIIFTLD